MGKEEKATENKAVEQEICKKKKKNANQESIQNLPMIKVPEETIDRKIEETNNSKTNKNKERGGEEKEDKEE